MGKSNTLTHEEIWDDSSLVRSWDDAVEEYQLYHSIHAKGENVEDVLREAEEAGLTEGDHVADDEEVDVQDVVMECEPEDSKVSAPDVTPSPKVSSYLFCGSMRMLSDKIKVQDESLKRLMMAWYYAGYYTGLHEGQQQANQTKS
ncbi:uncharacterized protein N7484_008688 [Penicillium longicatenatum]|uniref:uncharacterized protein n=1 Tax=Penicillium longicatenatum TaxID=1561947 RepID=UPI0025487A6D|nr:uncharacterized protein N7484_008688 [Penicillium longicatenatum]KAJ5635375.1 hypothetical protein N7484_008688 [Penicillium longicatenatum]